MQIVEEKIDNLNSKIKINLKPEDYNERVEKVLQGHKRKAQMPGFRPGKVPYGVIKKMYGKSVLVDEVNKLLVDELYKFIEEKSLNILGQPLPSEKQEDNIDWDNPQEMTFTYDVGLLPDVKVDLKGKFTYYNIEVSAKEIDEAIERIAKRYGKLEEGEKAGESDLIYGEFAELAEDGSVKEGGIKHQSSIAIDMVVDEKLKKSMVGSKKGDVFTFAPGEVTANAADLAAMLGISKEQADKLESKFQFTVEKVQQLVPAELNEEFFKTLYPAGDVKTEEELRAKIKEDHDKHYEKESDTKFKTDVILKLVADLKISLPDEFLKRWLVATNEKLTVEQIEADYEKYSDGLRWQLIENEVIRSNDIKVEQEEIKAEITANISQQYAYYGLPAPDDDTLEELTTNFMGRQDEIRKISDKLYDDKIFELFKKSFTLTNKSVSPDEFYKLAAEPDDKKSGLFSFLK